MNGILNVYKEKGFTSHDVVAKLRGILGMKKIGHTGTLDPDATGVLPVCVGKATKVCGLLTDADKTYEAAVRLGVTTDTQDMTGEILEKRPVSVSEEDIRTVLSDFIGEISQIPPMYSALKVNGKKLYELAREGRVVERKPRLISIYELVLTDIRLEENEFSVRVTCSKGTYIRTLCHDIGEKLGCGAAMRSLVRTRVGDFSIESAKTLGELERACRERGPECLLQPVDSVFCRYVRCEADGDAMKLLKNGNPLPVRQCLYEGAGKEDAGKEDEGKEDAAAENGTAGGEPSDGETVRMYGSDGEFYALYRFDGAAKIFRNIKMFHE